jgi:hypothetical protein
VPGTPADRPNWVLRLPDTLTALGADATLTAILQALQGRRLASHGRALEARRESVS